MKRSAAHDVPATEITRRYDAHVLVRAIARVYNLLGFHLTQRKLARTVPVVGVGMNAALSASMTKSVYQRAEDVYRLRFSRRSTELTPGTG